jgi:hypothetical protein
MAPLMKTFRRHSSYMRYVFLFLALLTAAYARLGENRAELVTRLGPVKLESKHFIAAQGQLSPLGPALFFEKDQWGIQCDMVDGRCAKITYNKKGEWTPDQIATLLQNNAQNKRWTEDHDSNKMIRKWTRQDGATAQWKFIGSMEFESPAYKEAKARREAELKAAAEKRPNL